MFETWKLLAVAGGMRLGDDFKGKNIKFETYCIFTFVILTMYGPSLMVSNLNFELFLLLMQKLG